MTLTVLFSTLRYDGYIEDQQSPTFSRPKYSSPIFSKALQYNPGRLECLHDFWATLPLPLKSIAVGSPGEGVQPLASPACTHLTSTSIAFHKAGQNYYILVACHVCF
jgi:hypothetical protein